MTPTKDPATGLSGRWIVILFYTLIFGGTAWVTAYSVQSSYHKRHIQGEFFPHLKVTGIVTPVTLQAEKHDETYSVRFVGVIPPSGRVDLLNGLNPEKEDTISNHTLQAYVFKRRIRFHSIDDTPTEGTNLYLEGYVELYGVDVGKKLIENGQAFASDIEHPRRELYLEMQALARGARKGVWRNLPE